ncbi:hypothetical protein HN51_021500 [Arachis hypogaea]|uniref:DUF506 family protein n=2 Tax=Arachis TaxID=3817 RepID=A0A445EFY9_ARAHY|nr:uncharacterized protein LOC107473472 [Arachis duranensis]XP_025643211.1 uncharacterized protein LOC112737499 [Arachis hypogaea]QHO52585.1 uncharacterized protein DS421_2g40490 [Arachis hypogaea]RYR74219.1 hypothetical protein Ahy_A02g008851 [Arachis hypogaea]
MKIQPVNSPVPVEGDTSIDFVAKPIVKSRFKRLFERNFAGVLRNSAAEKIGGGRCGGGGGGEEVQSSGKDGFNGSNDFEPSSACLAKMVQSFIEGNNLEKHSSASGRCGRNRSNCFNRICDDSSDDESDDSNCSPGEVSEILKGLSTSASVSERNLLAETAKIVEKNKICKSKDGSCRKIVTEDLINLGYDASICKSRWEKLSSYPAGEYEYIDVMIGKERLIVDVDFRSEFEIARSTKAYKAILQNLPYIFVGKCERLQRIVAVVSEAAKQSLKKKGMHVPPWRRVEYVRAKWLSPYTRITGSVSKEEGNSAVDSGAEGEEKEEEEEEEEKEEEVVEIQLKPPPVEMKTKGSTSLSGLAAVFHDDDDKT